LGADCSEKEPDRLGSGVVEPLSFTCPRCEQDVEARFYGPCDSCRADLRATQGNEKQELHTEAYEPKMNVTPNAVALKE